MPRPMKTSVQVSGSGIVVSVAEKPIGNSLSSVPDPPVDGGAEKNSRYRAGSRTSAKKGVATRALLRVERER
jgi:hypothetical protein